MRNSRRAAAFALPLLTLVACGDDGGGGTDPAGPALACDTNGEDVFATLPATVAPREGAIWVPEPGTSWHWQLTEDIDAPSITTTMADLDLFDACDDDLAELRSRDVTVICYFSAGSHEDWRPDADAYDDDAIGRRLDDWDGERWVDIRNGSVRAAIERRLDLAVARGCDGVEPDNVDGYQNRTGFDLTEADQRAFLQWLADAAHARGLSVGLKNATDLAEEFSTVFDWSLVEECHAYDECEAYRGFLDAGKAVFHVEYVDRISQGERALERACADPMRDGFSTLVKRWDLDPWFLSCDD